MIEFTLPSLPTLAELSHAKFWALGGGLAMVGFRVVSWISPRNTTFGEVKHRNGPAPEVLGLPATAGPVLSWPLLLRDACLGAGAAAIFAVAMARDESEFASLSLISAAIALTLALWTRIHRPAELVPVGEAPPSPSDEEADGVKKGSWAAVGFALFGLGMAALGYWSATP